MREIDKLPEDLKSKIQACSDANNGKIDNGGCYVWPDGTVRICGQHDEAEIFISPSMALQEYVHLKNENSRLEDELETANKFIASLGVKNVPCRCGSGGHPRRCERHPWAFDAHVAELNAEGYQECEDENERLRTELNQLTTLAAELIDKLPKCCVAGCKKPETTLDSTCDEHALDDVDGNINALAPDISYAKTLRALYMNLKLDLNKQE